MRKLCEMLMIAMSLFYSGMCLASSALFPDEGVGAVRLLREDKKQYSVEIIFPLNWKASSTALRSKSDMYKSDARISVNGPIYLFDDKGPIGSVAVNEFKLVFWCDSDAGIQFRPTTTVNIRKTAMARPLIRRRGFQNFVAFATLGGDINNPPSYVHVGKPLKQFSGDKNGDGKADASFVIIIDDANNCDGKYDTDKLIELDVGGGAYPLRCCGP